MTGVARTHAEDAPIAHGQAGAECVSRTPNSVSVHGDDPRRAPHEFGTLRFAAQRLARLFDARYVESPLAAKAEAHYWVPVSTLLEHEAAALGIVDGSQLWGGIASDGFAATKLVSHPLWKDGSGAPERWIDIAPIQCCTLPGYSVFCRSDAREAARELLREGSIRLKPACERGGQGQIVLGDEIELADWLSSTPPRIFSEGLVVERHLARATAYSVGFSVLPGGHRIAYLGTQRDVTKPSGAVVYGGSRIAVVRGGLETLSAVVPHGDANAVVCAAACYDALVRGAYGVVASRCNYDVVAGTDSAGRPHLGVLEQSWRFGGASMAELLAIERFAMQPDAQVLVAETVESYADEPVPADAVLYWPGDAQSPRKYARLIGETSFANAIDALASATVPVAG